MGSRQLFGGHELPSHHGGGFDRVPGSMAHLAEPMFDPDYMIPEGAEPNIAKRDYYKVMIGPDGTPRSVLVVVKGEKVDPARLEALDAEQAMFKLEAELEHGRHAGKREVSADPEGDADAD